MFVRLPVRSKCNLSICYFPFFYFEGVNLNLNVPVPCHILSFTSTKRLISAKVLNRFAILQGGILQTIYVASPDG